MWYLCENNLEDNEGPNDGTQDNGVDGNSIFAVGINPSLSGKNDTHQQSMVNEDKIGNDYSASALKVEEKA